MSMRRESFLAHVQDRGKYETPEDADRVARVVLALLGAHLVGGVRAELAARLPETYALVLLNPLQATEPLSPERFVRATAAWIEGATETTALWDIGAVLSTAAAAAGDALTRDVLLQLPPDYDLLFGHPPAQLTRKPPDVHRPEAGPFAEKGNRSMYDQPRPNPAPHAMTFDQMLERVRYEGAYPTRERAAEVVHQVLSALGRQLTGDERVELAQCLPVEAALALTARIPDTGQLTGWGFVKDLAARTGATPATARWDAGTVLAVVTRLAGPDLVARILRGLPDGYALLFGRAELRRREPAAA